MAEAKWTAEQKAEAVELAAQHGSLVASERTTIPASTIRSWLQRWLKQVEGFLPAELLDERPWPQKRAAIVQALATLQTDLLIATHVATAEGRLRDAQAGLVAIGIALDKCELLSGGATSRSESLSWQHRTNGSADTKAEIARLEQRLAELEAGDG